MIREDGGTFWYDKNDGNDGSNERRKYTAQAEDKAERRGSKENDASQQAEETRR